MLKAARTKASAPAALLGLYAQPDMTLVRGEGCRLWDDAGKAYLDFTAGIAVTALGHGSEVVHAAIRGSLERGLIHTSNLYRTRPAQELAELLVRLSYPGGVFFCNSGAEANEAALKFARRWAGTVHGPGRTDFLAFHGSFHGRLFGSLAITDRPGYQEPFRPLMPGARFADLGDVAAVEAELGSGAVAAVFIEPVQGEGGVVPVAPEFLRALKELCTEAGALLVFDEVQCGVGRTGRTFAWEHAGVVPDVMTLAKPLAAGLPMGAVVASSRVAETLRPGDHATTFGGGPLVASAALAVVRTVTAPEFLDSVRDKGVHLETSLDGLADSSEAVRGHRGLGLMRGVLLEGEAAPVVARARELGLLVVSAGPRVIRIVPPLTITKDELDEGVDLLARALAVA